nr:RNA-directed DNA polymerase, eukaryota [Tanacetum cinerariifolium]
MIRSDGIFLMKCCVSLVLGKSGEDGFRLVYTLREAPLSLMGALRRNFNLTRVLNKDTVNISHLFYADDAVFVGNWSERNIVTLTHVLKCFHMASRLKINMSKSKIMGVHVNKDVVAQAAVKLGCMMLKMPFIYLGSL